MKGNTLGFETDPITELPNNVIDTILGCLPLRDVVRTSILSREWRYKWVSCPELVFDFWFDQMFLGDHQLEPLVYQILKFHQGPLLKLVLQVPDLKSSPDIDHWVRSLPEESLQELTLHVSRGETHRLTPNLFRFKNLRHLKLYNCVFDPVPTFKGFGKLASLELQRVELVPDKFGELIGLCTSLERLRLVQCTRFEQLEITGPRLEWFEFHGVFKLVRFKNCPVLRDVKLTFSSMEFKCGNRRFSLELVTSLSSLPALEVLQLQAYALEDLVDHGALEKLPVLLRMLKSLHLSDMYFEKIQEISCAICFIRSCPNLQRLKITAFTLDVVDSVADFLRSQRCAEAFTQLRTVKMQLFSGIEAEMEFVKYLLACATALEEMTITPHASGVTDGVESILNELKQYPRASPSAEIFSWQKS